MYLEKNDEDPQNMTVSQQDVKNPTAQLKGLLGIGENGEATPVEETPVKNGKKESQKKDTPKTKGNKKNRNKTPKGSRDGQQANASSHSKSSSKKKNKNKSGQPPKENYAWSSFQSSPDASALPIPAFSSPVSSGKATSGVGGAETEKLSTLFGGLSTADEAIANAPRAEDLEAEVIAKAQQEAAAAKKEQEHAEETEEPNPSGEQKSPVEPEGEPISNSGVNLAAITSSPPQRPAPAPSAAASAPASTPAAPRNIPPPQFTPPANHGYGWNQHQQPVPYMGPSSGYITIQVQVPPVLMPGRRMMVTSPAGYPVQVAVPDGIPPGMVIPVSVPAGPIAGSPFGGFPNNAGPMHYPMYPQHPFPPHR